MDEAQQKQELRHRARNIRDGFSDPQSSAAQAAQHALQYVQSTSAHCVALYMPFGSELKTQPLAKVLWAAHIGAALPVVEALNAPLIFRKYSENTIFIKGLCWIFEPDSDADIVVPDVIFIPLLAYDAQGYRLGMGGGYYDRTLEQLRISHPHIRFIGYGFSAQEVAHVPHEVFDQRLHGVVTELGLTLF